MSTFAANITNSDAYWSKRRYELLATIEQRGLPTFFFTFSYANLHLPDLHRLMPGGPSTSRSQRYKNVLNNPHLVDWYYSYRLSHFIKVVFENILGSEWIFYRHERQSRDAIHSHGVCKLANDPGIARLTSIVYKGKLIEKQFPLNYEAIDKYDEYLDIIIVGKNAEYRVTSYVDTLITAINKKDLPFSPGVPEPHPCCIDIQLLPEHLLEEDYIELVNCTQRHVCRSDGYCKSKKKNMLNKCRFGYPFASNQYTKINFSSNSNNNVNAEICIARNDPYMNPHSRLIAQHWRSNVDQSAIINYRAAVNYMVKYATKSNLLYIFGILSYAIYFKKIVGEIPGQGFHEIVRAIGRSIKDGDNPVSKLKAIFLQSTCSKRDKGRPEVARGILGDHLFHSTFKYKSVSLDIGNKEIIPFDQAIDENQRSTYKNLMEYFGERANIPLVQPYLNKVSSFIEFCRHFDVVKGQLRLRHNGNKLIIITNPRVRYNTSDINTHQHYCYYQLIKYSSWTTSSIKNISKENAIELWKDFLNNAPESILNSIR